MLTYAYPKKNPKKTQKKPKKIIFKDVTLNAVINNILIYIYTLENINGNIGNKMVIKKTKNNHEKTKNKYPFYKLVEIYWKWNFLKSSKIDMGQIVSF
jgi:hypothetical protein